MSLVFWFSVCQHISWSYFIDKIWINVSMLLGIWTPRKFLLNYLWFFLVSKTSHKIYTKTPSVNVNLSMFYTNVILNNTESHVSVTRKHNTAFSYHCCWLVASHCSWLYSGEAVPQCSCQIPCMYKKNFWP